MSILPLIIIAMTTMFVASLLTQSRTQFKFCAVCVTVSSTWLALLGMRLLGIAINPMLIGVLMGESIIGLYYLLERHTPPAWQIFRWPYIITMTTIVYLIIGVRSGLWAAVALLIAIWVIWGSIFVFREFPSIKKITQRLIACCRDW